MLRSRGIDTDSKQRPAIFPYVFLPQVPPGSEGEEVMPARRKAAYRPSKAQVEAAIAVFDRTFGFCLATEKVMRRTLIAADKVRREETEKEQNNA